MECLLDEGIEVIVYESLLSEKHFFDVSVINDLSDFKQSADVIVANRLHEDLEDVVTKVYSRDLFGYN